MEWKCLQTIQRGKLCARVAFFPRASGRLGVLQARRERAEAIAVGEGPRAQGGTGARLESRSLGRSCGDRHGLVLAWRQKPGSPARSGGGRATPRFLGCPRDGTWGCRTKGSSSSLRSRTASRSTAAGRKSPSCRFLTRRRGAGLAVRPDGRLRRERSGPGDLL